MIAPPHCIMSASNNIRPPTHKRFSSLILGMHLSLKGLSRKYIAVVTRFFRLAAKLNWPQAHLKEITTDALLQYLRYLTPSVWSKKLRIGSIKSYLSALKEYHLINGVNWKAHQQPLVVAAIKALNRIPTAPSTQGYAISLDDMLSASKNVVWSNWIDVITMTIANILFCSLGRTYELLHAPSHPPMLSKSLIFDHQNTRIFLERPKINANHSQFLTPLNIPRLEPIAWIIRFLALKPKSANLWTHSDGSRFTSQQFNAHFKVLAKLHQNTILDPSSFRAGGTTLLVSSKQNLELIRILGRWNSNAFYRYIRNKGQSLSKAFNLNNI